MLAISACVVALLLLVVRLAGPRPWTRARAPAPLARAPIAGDSGQLWARVDERVEGARRAARVPGIGLVVVRDSAIVHLRGFGVAGPDGRPVTPQTGFILGSLSKAFTALAVLQLADSGRVALDAPVQRYLPWFRVDDPAASRRITVRQLLNHTSGIPVSEGLLVVKGSRAATVSADAALMRRVKLHHAPGDAFEYSNANYWLLGLIVEAASGERFESFVRSHVLEPLGMRQTFTSETAARAHDLASGYRVWFGAPRAENLPYYARELAVGYLISTPEDMGKLLIAELDSGRYRGAAVVSGAALALSHTPPAGSPYAMAWLADSIGGVPVLWHNGAVANYHCDMLIVPSARVGVAVLSNVNNILLEHQFSQVIKDVTTLLLGFEPPARPLARYRDLYWGIAAFAGAWLVWRASQAIALSRRCRRKVAQEAQGGEQPPEAWRRIAVLVDPGVSLGLMFGLPRVLHAPLSTVRWFVPDLATWLLVNVAVSVVLSGGALFIELRGTGSARTRPDDARQSR